MAYKYTYPVIDRSLRDFLAFLLMLLAVVAVAAAIGTVSGVDTSGIDTQTMGISEIAVDHMHEEGKERAPLVTIQPIDGVEPVTSDSSEGEDTSE